jgi:hypothetical protein
MLSVYLSVGAIVGPIVVARQSVGQALPCKAICFDSSFYCHRLVI